MGGLRRRISKGSVEPTKTDETGAKVKLGDLVMRAKQNGSMQGPLVPIEALVTVSQDEWTWPVSYTHLTLPTILLV